MFNFFKKSAKPADLSLYAITAGLLKPITAVEDEVFSTKMMGDGFAIEPQADEIFAPSAGEVISIFPTKHAVTFKLTNGAEVLLHMGIDTVELEGVPFEILVKEGEQVTAESPVAKMNRRQIEDNSKTTDVILIVTNSEQFPLPEIQTKAVQQGEAIGVIKEK
ncbi:PTS sugar transporter subunit IIA [Candidatus Enterococcus ferrettii]|uniref:PTS system, sugar-specific IIA component n=1 Tax=Candidatus Enterococcus ferrettii TaxID=2815324 RepID=A0ABV0ELW4_9ENTE|nr:PTS glucose transporter subunit IIA [Enterococcus sp. 665A]MBO1338301.1 PTS glucose transporter subunit IIA [Enterococcus sp. 665A]